MLDHMLSRISHWLIYLAIPLAAFLTFLIQPVVGKLVLPLYGGGSGSWITSVFFFQGALLGGYLFAYALVKQRQTVQTTLIILVALLAPASLRLPLFHFDDDLGPRSLLFTLALSIGLQLLFTTAIGIVIQGWVQAKAGKVPYYLYAISNLGSLAALLVYPFVIEPKISLDTQILVLRVISLFLSIICIALAWSARTLKESPSIKTPEIISTMQKGSWLILSFFNCVLMMSATRILAVEYGSNPLTWIIPLGLYLASFSVTFTARWNNQVSILLLIVLCAALPIFMLSKGIMSVPLTGRAVLLLVILIAVGSLVANSLLYEKRPQRDFASFYLAIALGGALGGLFVSLSAPTLFSRNYEFIGALVAIAVLGGAAKVSQVLVLSRFALATLVIAPIVAIGAKQIADENKGGAQTLNLRNYFGHIVLQANAGTLKCFSETTLHGSQFTIPEHRQLPTAYYAEGSAVGLILRNLQQDTPKINIGVVGLGIGTLAAYVRKADSIVFWEIDPLMQEVALDAFSFISEAKGQTEIRMIDGRLGIREAAEQFDILIIDAFSGDSIPLHLVTREALQEYASKTRSGIIAINISNRYIDLLPVVAAHAEALDLKLLTLLSAPPSKPTLVDALSTPSRYAIISSAAHDARIRTLIAEAPARTGWSYRSEKIPERLVKWTDSRHSILDVLDLRSAILGEVPDSGKL